MCQGFGIQGREAQRGGPPSLDGRYVLLPHSLKSRLEAWGWTRGPLGFLHVLGLACSPVVPGCRAVPEAGVRAAGGDGGPLVTVVLQMPRQLVRTPLWVGGWPRLWLRVPLAVGGLNAAPGPH